MKVLPSELRRMLDNYRNAISGSNVQVYVPKVVRFLEECRGDFSKEAVLRHLDSLREQGYADGTIDLAFRTIRRFYKVNNLPWPFKYREGPVIREREVYAPALSPDVIAQVIEGAKNGVLNEAEACMVALSTVYGLRRSEMASLSQEAINLRDRLLFIETKKYGRQRYHIIPEEIFPYLERYPLRPCSPIRLTQAWYRIEEKLGLGRLPEVGWHAIRRMLDRLLINTGLPEFAVNDFLRWKRSSRSMVARYYSVTVVGRDSYVELNLPDRQVDEMVFRVHPFLPVWRERHGEKTEEGSKTPKRNRTRNKAAGNRSRGS